MALAGSAHAATVCVDQHGKPGCVSTITEGVAAANPGDTITVAAGTYKEDVVIGKSLSLVGADREATIIDATGLSNGIYIDGYDNANLSDLIVTGFTVKNANFEDILAVEAINVTLWGNIVTSNDKSLQASIGACPGEPAFETAESTDCGGGIHLIGTDHSNISYNLVELNAGGILISDEVATSHDNFISRNLVQNNGSASGVTLSSHPAYANPSSPAPVSAKIANGIYNNVVSENDLIHNGFGGAGGGGVLIDAAGNSERAYANTVTRNRFFGNAMAGLMVHNDANFGDTGSSPNPDVSRNALVGNYFAGNGADPFNSAAGTAGISIYGVSPIVDLLVTGNIIVLEDTAVAVNSGAELSLNLNAFQFVKLGVASFNALGTVNARENWWGCSGGPGAWGCAGIKGDAIAYTPWLTGAVTEPTEASLGYDHAKDCDHGGSFGRNH
jgi:hypothetical protein